MRITSIQLEINERSKGDTLDHTFDLIEKAPPSDLIILPEMWTCGYFSFEHYWKDSEPQDGPTVKALQEKAAQRHCFILMGSMAERGAGPFQFNHAS